MGRKEHSSDGMKRHPMERYLELFPPADPGEERDTDENGRKAPPSPTTLDLHGMNREETRIALSDFLRNCRRRGIRRVLVIHGKGIHSQGPAVLGNYVKELLKSSNEVEDFGPAPPRKGGSGATWVLLRQRSR
ncbi:MAG: Smr/MutS family protein [Spirochaetales bacterium]